MLGLQCATSEEWVQAVNRDPALVLRDHAHCEKKAATMAISLLNRYPEKSELVRAMADLAQEEMSHFRMVLDKMTERGIGLVADTGDHYARQLHDHIRKQEPYRLLDTLIVSSLIEARSCERFSLLSRSVEDEDLRLFYRSLLESEARHRTEFLALARTYFDKAEVAARLDELETLEATIVQNLQHEPVMHG
jgi:tRNA-(ms[2]io[6]A)-hydroxylase